MTIEPECGITCDMCKQVPCLAHYPKGIPEYCSAIRYHALLEQTKSKYSIPEEAKVYMAAGKVISEGHLKWPRVQAAVEFAKELGVARIGLATCVGLASETWDISEFFRGAGFTVIGVACQIGRVGPSERGFPKEYEDCVGYHCNPIAQAEILNYEGTELNFIIGLCLGHDILFTKYSKAPVSTLIVKDLLTGHNPTAAVNSYHYRRELFREYCGKDVIHR